MGVWIGERQIGHSGEAGCVRGGTTRIGSCVMDEIGGPLFGVLIALAEEEDEGSCGESDGDGDGAIDESETVFGVRSVLSSIIEGGPEFCLAIPKVGFARDPETTGGGRSRPSTAFLESCLAKSLACHHSKNFSANILVGSRSFRLENNLELTMWAIIAGLRTLLPCPGRAPKLLAGATFCSARAIAR